MLELVRQARLVWTSVMEVAGLMAPDATDAASIDAAAQVVHDTATFGYWSLANT